MVQSSPIVKPDFEELSADLRWKLARRWENRDLLITAVSLTASTLLLAPVAVPQANWALEQGFKTHTYVDSEAHMSADYQGPLKKGDKVAGHAVTSEFDLDRVHPVHGDIRPHNGVDVGTPIGTPIYAPVEPSQSIRVRCWWDDAGGGKVATWIQPDGNKMQALHLSKCATGTWKGGEKFAETGDTGIGTGPHLHFEQWKGNDRVSPQKGWLIWALTGNRPYSLVVRELEDLVKNHEGYREHAYLDPVGVPTIGYGTTVYPDGKPVQLGDTVSQDEADRLLQHDLGKAKAAVEGKVSVPLKPTQLQALTSFTYNVGVAAMADSTLVRKLNAGDREGAAAEFDRWVHGDGVVLPGLVKRRAAEKILFENRNLK